jgi:hypothetical protein
MTLVAMLLLCAVATAPAPEAGAHPGPTDPAAPAPLRASSQGGEGGAPKAARRVYTGRPLDEVLRELQSRGVPLVFTSELVRPGMTVVEEPGGGDAAGLLASLLAPHGLAVQAAPGGVLVVVRAEEPARGSVVGHVLARGGGVLPGAAITVAAGQGPPAATAADGSFRIGGLAAGNHVLIASAPGYLEQRTDLLLAAGAVRRVELRLAPQPVFAGEIVVQPSRLTLLRERPDSSFSLGREEIDRLPHLADDVFRAAALLPGTAANDVSARLEVHGGRSDEVRVLLDGQELYEPFHLADYDHALSIVPARSLDGVTLTTGAYPASHGDRMSGVLDLRTATPVRQGEVLLSLSVLDALAVGGGRFANERGAWLVSGRRGSLDQAGDAIGGDDPLFWDLFAKSELDTRRGRFGMRLLTARDELTVEKADEESFETFANDYRSTYGWLSHQHAGARLLVDSVLSWARLARRRGGMGEESDGGFALRDRRDVRVWGGEQAWALQLAGPGSHVPRWGAEARHYEASLDYAKRLDDPFVVRAPFAPPRLLEHAFAGELSGEHYGLWASDRFALGGAATAELGLRHDRHPGGAASAWSPRANLAVRLGERSVGRLSWGHFFQSQRPYELQVEDGERLLAAAAERSTHWVAGWERLLAPNRAGIEGVRLELYRRSIARPRVRYENLLEPLNVFQEIEPDRVRIAPARARAEGAELLLRGTPRRRLDWWLAYGWARSEDRLDDRWVPRARDQRHSLVLDLGWRLPRGWTLDAAWRYHTGWPTTPVHAAEDDEGALTAVFGPLRSERLPDYHRLDVRASRSWPLRVGRLTFFVDLQNVYDRANLSGFDVELDEDAGVVLLESERWPGLFPSLGITWER